MLHPFNFLDEARRELTVWLKVFYSVLTIFILGALALPSVSAGLNDAGAKLFGGGGHSSAVSMCKLGGLSGQDVSALSQGRKAVYECSFREQPYVIMEDVEATAWWANLEAGDRAGAACE